MTRSLRLSALTLATLLYAACGPTTPAADPTETTAADCQDGEDNDSDGLADCEDSDCQGYVFCVQSRPSEVTAVECSDGADNDADGKADCLDTNCQGFVFCQSAESSSTACSDGADNDGDGEVDCADADCAGLVFCQPPAENTAALCGDGDDNDGDGLTDCEDPECGDLVACAQPGENTSASCRDTRDNDGDGLADCADPDCAGFTFCAQPTETTATACQDTRDNDGDGKIDCLDPDCGGFTFCFSPDETTAVACEDGQDNDSDGLTDCDDPDCAGFIFCRSDLEVSSAACQDGTDNDSDGLTDCNDPDCLGYVFCLSDESTTAACKDAADNDSDGLTDCADPDCQGFVFCASEETTAAACQDAADNDTDGLTDCADPDCAGFTFCAAQTEDGATTCQDGLDNDGDGLTDCEDPGCAGFTFCAAPTETTIALCQDGADNDGDGLVDCEDPDCGGFVQCGQGPSETTLAECQDGADNDGDGDVDCDDPGCWPLAICGHYHGFPLYDGWGDAWDGLERQALTWAEAEQTCRDLGGRLPTATELWRNNWASGSGDLADQTASSYLWTRIARQAADQYAVVRLSDGNVTYHLDTAATNFRCIWPDSEGEGFDGYRCYGPPGQPCYAFGRYLNVDAMDRAPLDYAAAANECEFYGASLPATAEWGELIHAGLPNATNAWLWSAKPTYWYSGNYGTSIVRFTEDSRPHWAYTNSPSYGGLSTTATNRQFRCVGLARPADFSVPNPSTCNGGCASFNQRRSPVVADTSDRVAVRMAAAAAACRSEGALLPNLSDATDLVHGGWENGSNQWNWVTDAMYWYNGNYGHGLVRWNGPGPESFAYFNGTYGTMTLPQNNEGYRCVWHARKPEWPTCQSGEVIRWNGSAFACATGGDGSSGGHANVVEMPDAWGNAWDGLQRNTAATWEDAKTTCESLGGRLPTASELWAVRASGNPHPSIGDVNSTSYLWTSTPALTVGQYVIERISDGVTTATPTTSVRNYRCIWPSVRSDVLEGRNCYGPPGSECFVTSDGLVSDRYDRVKVSMASAIEECRAAGGRLPDHRDLIRLIHSGLPNGTNAWQWMADSLYWYNGGYGYALARWSGTGTPSWEWTYSANAALSGAGNGRNFRCVYDPFLR